MSTVAAIWDAFALKLASFAADLSPALPVSYQGVHFDPPTTGQWLAGDIFPNANLNLAWGDATDHRGFCQVTVSDRGQGVSTVLELAAAVQAEFAKGTLLGPARVYEKPSISSVLTEDDRRLCAVTIRYRGSF